MTTRPPKAARTDSPSSLSTSADRFLSQVVSEALEDNWRTPDDFLTHFGPRDLMEGFSSNMELRAEILVAAAGVHDKLARKKSTSSATEDLELALGEGLTDARQVVALIPADDRVRYLNKPRLWAFAFQDQFWSGPPADVERSAERMAFLIRTALDEHLLTLEKVFDALGVDEIAKHLPPEELRKLVSHALGAGRRKELVTEESVLDVVPLTTLLRHVPFKQTWDTVVLDLVAKPCHLLGGSNGTSGSSEPFGAGSGSRGAAPPAAPAQARPAKAAEPLPAPTADRGAANKPAEDRTPAERATSDKLSSEAKASASPLTSKTLDEDVNLDFDLDSPKERPPAEQEARNKVISKLTSIDRLPPRHEGLTTPMLLSIDSMYEELFEAEDDEDREGAMRDSFPNETHLRQALLALIELLDPSIDTKGSVMQGADVASLIKVVLFEERRRAEPGAADSGGAGSSPPRRATPSPVPPARASAPPQPKSSLPPPPPLVKRPR